MKVLKKINTTPELTWTHCKVPVMYHLSQFMSNCRSFWQLTERDRPLWFHSLHFNIFWCHTEKTLIADQFHHGHGIHVSTYDISYILITKMKSCMTTQNPQMKYDYYPISWKVDAQIRSLPTLQIYTAGNGTDVKNVKVTSICRRYYNVEV